jgi:hypothetical protein
MAYQLTDEQREILGREMQFSEIDSYVEACFDRSEEETEGSGAAAVEAKIDIIAASQSPNPYDEMRRRTYPSMGDQLDALFHAGVFPDDMAAKLQAVKAAHPKP